MIEAAREGRSAALLVHGEAGMGKTSLLRDAAEHATGLRVLRARGIESESHLPFAALSELLAPLLDLRSEIPPVQATALGGALALEAATVTDRFAVAAGVLSLLAAAAERQPVLALADDLQWLDEASREALRVRRAAARRRGRRAAVRAARRRGAGGGGARARRAAPRRDRRRERPRRAGRRGDGPGAAGDGEARRRGGRQPAGAARDPARAERRAARGPRPRRSRRCGPATRSSARSAAASTRSRSRPAAPCSSPPAPRPCAPT